MEWSGIDELAARDPELIVRATKKLPEFSALGRHPEIRELSVPDLPYLIVYKVRPEAVTILTVFSHIPRSRTGTELAAYARLILFSFQRPIWRLGTNPAAFRAALFRAMLAPARRP